MSSPLREITPWVIINLSSRLYNLQWLAASLTSTAPLLKTLDLSPSTKEL